jgi:hypothetical protein
VCSERERERERERRRRNEKVIVSEMKKNEGKDLRKYCCT